MSENIRLEALEQIKQITQTIESNNKIQFPSKRFLFYGIGILLVPAIEYPTQILTFGADFGAYQFHYLAIVHVVFYFFYFRLIRFLVHKSGFDVDEEDGSHQLIKKALSLYGPIVLSIAGLVILLPIIGQVHLAYPIVFILMALLLNIYGNFISKAVVRTSWFLVFVGLVYVYVSQYQNTEVWIVFNSILGFSFVYLGISHKDRGANN